MMRPTMSLLCVLCVLAGVWPWWECEAAKPRRRAPAVVECPFGNDAVVGVGKTVADAEEDALEQARKGILAYFAEQYGDADLKLTPAKLRALEVARRDGEPLELNLERAGLSWEVKLKVELTPESVREIQKLAREQRMEERQRLAARWLGGLLAVLLVMFGYLRLEDATRGYHTTLLRLAALGVLTAAGLFLWQLG